MRRSTRVGITGLIIFAALGAVAALVLHKPAAVPLSAGWWAAWAPGIGAFLVLVAAGLPSGACGRRTRRRA